MRRPWLLLACSVIILVTACGHRGPATVGTEPTQPRPKGWTEKGDASWYGEPYHGRKAASGETYNMHDMTAAHRSLPFDTVVRVTRRDTGGEVEVRINDRGPFIKGRIIDLSYAAAKVIRLDLDGVAPVKLKVLDHDEPKNPDQPPVVPRTAGENEQACFWVQVGAFGDATNARRARQRLHDAGESAVVMEGPDGLDRVRVGPFDREKDAEKASKRLRGDWPAARVVECGG